MSNEIVQLNEQVIRTELKDLVRQSVEEILNGLLDAEADRLTNARKYERTEGRQDTRAGHYPRKLLTGVGEVELEVPKLRT
ncbi:MAG: transposase, partial [Anaerolineaceae bacterium]